MSDEENKDENKMEDSSVGETKSNETKSNRKPLIVFIVILLLAPTLGFLSSHYIFVPMSEKEKASNELSTIAGNRGSIQAKNTDVVTFEGQALKGANTDQKALSSAGIGSDAGVFVFTNGKDSADKKTLDIYIDFDSQYSRDFILLNQGVLKGMVENGVVDLYIHPVPSGSALSMYSPEALAEAFVSTPDKTWDFFIGLLKLSAETKTDKSEDSVKSIVDLAKDKGISDISDETIEGGTFSSWILAVGDDTKLDVGYYPPIAYLNGNIIDPDKVDFNDSDAFRTYVLNN